MFKRLSSNYKAILLALIGFLAFSVSDTVVKFLTPHYSIYQIIVTITFLATLLLLSCAPFLGGVASLYDTRNLKFHVLRGVLNFLTSLLVVSFLKIMPLSAFYTAVFVMPFMMTLISIPVLKEHVGWHRWLAIIGGFFGVLIAFRPWQADLSFLMLLALLSMPFVIALFHIVLRLMKAPSLLAVGVWPFLISAILTAPLLFLDGNLTPVTLPHMALFLVPSLAISIGILTLSGAFQIADSSLVSPIQYTQMIWGVLFGYFIFSDLPDLWMLLGAGVIIASGLYLIHRERG